MGDIRESLYGSFRSSFGGRTGELLEIQRMKSRDDRLTSLSLFVGERVAESGVARIGGSVFAFNGRFYEPDLVGDWLDVLRRVVVECGVVFRDAMAVVNERWLGAYVRSAPLADSSLVCFRNGVFDLRKRVLLPFGPDYMVDGLVDYDYDRSARCPRWEAFLEWALPDEGERLRLQEMFGSCYLDRRRYSIERFAVLIGAGANGKSVICETIKAVMGGPRYVKPLDAEQLRNEKYQPELVGARCNIASDCRADAAFDSALKSLVSGQEIMGRRNYGQPESIFACPIVFTMNALPPFRDKTDGFFRRLLLFEFERSVPEGRQDKGLSASLVKEEAAGIFNWLLEGAGRLASRGYEFSPCAKMDDAVEALKKRVRGEETPVLSWLESRGLSPVPLSEGQKGVRLTASEIFEGLGGTVSRSAITRELSGAGVKMARNREMVYYVYNINDYESKE